ncbi:hypothetical protein C4K22_4479 [Pseudomonas chlororaphis subsp. aurantiaca]|nr:hypothetical protein C4K22_4479 [Pseudomonas chlororaphis subsp. aurantiaca]AZD43547.1 hypothetical protein C4K21_4487 [Pseudomonas chlororaphis subsp. aurantiaca]AZD49786.1 hypothetical protein C4K20_4385 [Pseudomonas chlororaphis subsp. aurantiaca]
MSRESGISPFGTYVPIRLFQLATLKQCLYFALSERAGEIQDT